MAKRERMYSFVFSFLFILLIVTFVSCNLIQSSEEIKTGDTLVIPLYQRLVFINPLTASSTLSTRLYEMVFDGLIQLDDHFEPKPHLATSWKQSEDGRTWTFYLRQGVRFHDGMELTAEDVKFTFQKVREAPAGSRFVYISHEIQDVRVQDRYTLEIELGKPTASFLELLEIGILPKHLLEGEDLTRTRFNQHPIGTGPFKLKYWSEKEVLLQANKDYFGGRPYLDQIHLIVFSNREAAWAKLMAGEGDFFFLIAPSNFDMMQQVPIFHYYSISFPFYYLIAFNLKDPMFNDQRMRQALNYAVDKEMIVEKVLKGQGQVAHGSIHPSSWAFDPNIKPYPYDPKKALKLLKEIGWADHDGDHFLDKEGKPLEFTVHVNVGDDVKQKTLLLIQQDLMDIGIRMNIKIFDAADLEFLFNKQFQAFFPEIFARGDPDHSYRSWHSSQIEKGFNVSSYHNPMVDRLLEEGRTEIDQEQRKAIYFRFQEEMLKDPPGIFLFWTNYLVGLHQRFKGIKASPIGPFANIREWYVPKAEQRYSELKSE
jgi:peptide/nickel transport system substrate-binding protein